MSLPYPNFNPVAVAIPTPWFSLPIRWYALAYIVSILGAWRYAQRLLRKPELWGDRVPLTSIQLDDLILWATFGIILGGRLGFMLFYSPSTFFTDPIQIIKTWEGGMSFHGGFLGVVIAISLFAWRRKISLIRLGDLAAPCAPIGLGIVRIANFVNGELWGRTTTLPWGMVFPRAGDLPRHPSQLYEAGLEGGVMFLILRLATHRFGALRRPGLTTGLFLALYGLFRFTVEHVREPDVGMPDFPFGLTMGMILSLPMLFIGAVVVASTLQRPAIPLATPTDEMKSDA